MEIPDFGPVLANLNAKRVDFIVVGGVSAVLQGAGAVTFDLDIVHSTDDANVQRLLSALETLDAYYRLQPERRLRPSASHLSSKVHNLLMTRYGPLDVLGAIGNGRNYADLLSSTDELDTGEGVKVRVLNLEAQIKVKEEINGEKDPAVLPLLRRTLEEKRRRS